MENISITAKNQQHAEKIKEGQKYIPYKLLEQIVIETNINKKLIEEINSELWYETLNGVGHIEFNNNTLFQGNMENGIIDSGKQNVLCKFKFADGTEYEGEVRDNKLTGNGKFIFPTKAIYTGQVLNGLRHGYGVFTSPNGIIYEGEWFKGLKHGKGKQTINNDMIYDGEWNKGYIQGEGKMTWENGNVYNGQFIASHMCGDGYMIWYNKAQKYYGQWKNNMQNGCGVLVWYDVVKGVKLLRNRYVGEWVNGVRNGYGTFFYANGNKYEGFWENNYKNGFGVYTFQNGDKYIGMFEKDRMLDKDNQINESDIDDVVLIKSTQTNNITQSNNITPNNHSKHSTKKEHVNGGVSVSAGVINASSTIEKKFTVRSIERLNSKVSSKHDEGTNNVNTNTHYNHQQQPKTFSITNVNSHHIFPHYDITDLTLIDPSLHSDLPEINNILRRSLSDITNLYNVIIRSNVLEKDDTPTPTKQNQKETTFNNEMNIQYNGKGPLIPEEIPKQKDSKKKSPFARIKKKQKTPKKKKPVKVLSTVDPIYNEITESIKTNNVSYCITLKDIWRYLREHGILDINFNICDFNRIFYSGECNHYHMYLIPDTLSNSNEIYDYLHNSIYEAKEQFILENAKYIKYYCNSNSPCNDINNYQIKRIHLEHSIHEMTNIIMPRFLLEVALRAAFMKEGNDKLSEKLKQVLTLILPVRSKKTKGSIKTSISKLEASFVNAQVVQENKSRVLEKLMLDEYFKLFLSDIEYIFNHVYAIYSRNKFINKNDKTIPHRFIYDKLILQSKQLKRLIPTKVKYVELATYFYKDKPALTAEAIASDKVKYYTYFEDLFDSEVVLYEFGEVLFFIARKYISYNKLYGIVQHYKEAIDIVKKVVECIYKKTFNKAGYINMCCYPQLDTHLLRQKLLDEAEIRAEEERKREEEWNRCVKERCFIKMEDQNVYVEEVEEEDEEEEEDDDYYD